MIDIVLYRERILSYPPHTILEMIDMNNREYDIKLTPLFNGVINYTREDYLSDKKYQYSFRYLHGELCYVAVYLKTEDENHHVVYKDAKILDADKFNQKFWLKAPKYLHFDDGRWERDCIIFGIDVVTAQPCEMTCIIP